MESLFKVFKASSKKEVRTMFLFGFVHDARNSKKY